MTWSGKLHITNASFMDSEQENLDLDVGREIWSNVKYYRLS
jgi:hypothetical protein